MRAGPSGSQQPAGSLNKALPTPIPRKLERHRPASSVEPDPELLSEPVDPGSEPPKPAGIQVISSWPLEAAEPSSALPAELADHGGGFRPRDAQNGSPRESDASAGGPRSSSSGDKAKDGNSAGSAGKRANGGLPGGRLPVDDRAPPHRESSNTLPNSRGDSAVDPKKSLPSILDDPLQHQKGASEVISDPAQPSQSRSSLLYLEDDADGHLTGTSIAPREPAAADRSPGGGAAGQPDAATQRTEPQESRVGDAAVSPAPPPLKPRPPLEKEVAGQLAALGVEVHKNQSANEGGGIGGGNGAIAAIPPQGLAVGGAKRRPPTSGTLSPFFSGGGGGVEWSRWKDIFL
jgi:hypothetical protein